MPDDNLDQDGKPIVPDNLDQEGDKGKWRLDFPEEIRDSADLLKFDESENPQSALAQSYINASQLIGRDKIPMPKSEAEWNETYSRLGRPDAEDDYEILTPDGIPESMKDNMNNAIKWFKTTAHKTGMNQTQAQGFFKDYTNLVVEETRAKMEKENQEASEAKIALQTEYGDSLPAKMVLANRAMDKFGGEELVQLFADTGLGRDPRVIKAFISMGELIAEDVGLDKQGEPIESASDIDTKIAELQAKPAYLDAMDPAHDGIVRQVETLMKRRHPKPGI